MTAQKRSYTKNVYSILIQYNQNNNLWLLHEIVTFSLKLYLFYTPPPAFSSPNIHTKPPASIRNNAEMSMHGHACEVIDSWKFQSWVSISNKIRFRTILVWLFYSKFLYNKLMVKYFLNSKITIIKWLILVIWFSFPSPLNNNKVHAFTGWSHHTAEILKLVLT